MGGAGWGGWEWREPRVKRCCHIGWPCMAASQETAGMGSDK